MLRGKAIIELTDVNSGEKEVYEDENMVTNAISELLQPLYGLKSQGILFQSMTPYYETLFGGLLLFDVPLEEKEDNYYAPGKANMVGCAVYEQQNTTTNTCRGGYNQSESEIDTTQKYAKYVYDFTTAQANGTIASVCLTHKIGGYSSYGYKDASQLGSAYVHLAGDCGANIMNYSYPSYTGGNTIAVGDSFALGKSEIIFLLDPDNDTAYYIRYNSVSSISIITRCMRLKQISLFESPYNNKPIMDEKTITLETSFPAIPSASTCYAKYDVNTNALWIISSTSSVIESGAEFLLTKISFPDFNVTQYKMINTTGAKICLVQNAIVNNGNLYVRTYASPYVIYMINIEDNTEVFEVESDIEIDALIPGFAYNDRVYYAQSYRNASSYPAYVVNGVNKKVEGLEQYVLFNVSSNYITHFIPIKNHPMIYYAVASGSSTGNIVFMGNYLATINNLSSPITKTADKTMKITYIIQEQ